MIYGNKEKLSHFRQLINPNAADADLHLLAEKSPASSNLTKYAMRPSKNHNEILFDLLDVCTHEEIVRNRRQFLKEDEAPKDVVPKNEAPKETGKKAKNSVKKQKKEKGSAPKKKKANAIEEKKAVVAAADKKDTAEGNSEKKGSDTESSGQDSSEKSSSVAGEKKSG